MKQGPTLFLNAVIVLIGLAVLVMIIFFTSAALKDDGRLLVPVLIILYLTALPFYLALYQALKLLSYIDKHNAFSELSVKALKTIKYCAFAISALYVAAMPFLVSVADKDDAPGAVGFGIIFIFFSIVVATFAAVIQKLVQNGLDMKSENELTV